MWSFFSKPQKIKKIKKKLPLKAYKHLLPFLQNQNEKQQKHDKKCRIFHGAKT